VAWHAPSAGACVRLGPGDLADSAVADRSFSIVPRPSDLPWLEIPVFDLILWGWV
jgi:hypothetical protein